MTEAMPFLQNHDITFSITLIHQKKQYASYSKLELEHINRLILFTPTSISILNLNLVKKDGIHNFGSY